MNDETRQRIRANREYAENVLTDENTRHDDAQLAEEILWLVDELNVAKADAWDEGRVAMAQHHRDRMAWEMSAHAEPGQYPRKPTNPYRQETPDEH